ncbi:hypothetical protein LCGC14_2750830, partial [marine sediment metagenome]
MRIKLIWKQDEVERFWAFIKERQEIWHKRFIKKIASPWTKDPILKEYKFCNVYRSLDRGTQYVRQNILTLYPRYRSDCYFNLLLYRLFNLPETHTRFQAEFATGGHMSANEYNASVAAGILIGLRAHGIKFSSSAYMLSSAGYYGPNAKIKLYC